MGKRFAKSEPVGSYLAWGALGQNALQGASMHVEPAGGFRHVAITQLIDPLDMFNVRGLPTSDFPADRS